MKSSGLFLHSYAEEHTLDDVDNGIIPAGIDLTSGLPTIVEPFFGGTYFPPETFQTLLLRVAELWANHGRACPGCIDMRV